MLSSVGVLSEDDDDLMKDDMMTEETRLSNIEEAPLGQLIAFPQFYVVYLMNMLTILHGLFIVGSNKAWGEQMLMEESFLSNIAKFACIFGALRFFWSFFVDSWGYKRIYGASIALQIVIGLTMP